MDFKSNIEQSQSSNKSFGLVFGTVFALISLYSFFWIQSFFYLFFLLSSLFFFFSFFYSKFLAIPNKIWTNFGIALGHIVSFIIMAFIFYFLFFPLGFILKLFKSIDRNKFDVSPESYWKKKEKLGTMKDQF
tara:strand:+ start:5135 stop:5530 length:396 start_codon:yes stop_codon:yes gene_type:complete